MYSSNYIMMTLIFWLPPIVPNYIGTTAPASYIILSESDVVCKIDNNYNRYTYLH